MPSLFNFLGTGTKLGFPIGTVGRPIQLFVLREEYVKSVTKGSSP